MGFYRSKKSYVRNTVKTDYDGFTFASKFEAAVYQILKMREKAGEISELSCQSRVTLTRAKILFIPDFKYKEDGIWRYGEAKGFETAVYRIKRRLWCCYGPGPLDIWKGSYKKPYLVETIIPDGL